MDLFSKQKFFIWVVAILVLLNVVTIFFMWYGRPEQLPPPPRNGNPNMGEFLTRELGLSNDQMTKINEYRKQHFEITSSITRKINEKKKEIMDEVFSGNPDKEKVNKLAGEIGDLNTQLEEFLFDHFLKLKSVMNNEQAGKFEKLIHESMRPGLRELPGQQDRHRIPPPPPVQ